MNEPKGISSSCNNQSTLSRNATEDSKRWNKAFQELLNYKEKHGNCLVPYNYDKNPSLYMWVKRQRYQYSLFLNGNPESSMSPQRIQILENIGFVWDVHSANWEKRFQELCDYKQQHGHCNLPSSYPPNKVLAAWVHRQRNQYKLFFAGKQSALNNDRIMRLEELGFQWEIRRLKRRNSVTSNTSNTSKKRKPREENQCRTPMAQMPYTMADYAFFMEVLSDLSDTEDDSDDDDDIKKLELATFKELAPLECSTMSLSEQTSQLLRDVIGKIEMDESDNNEEEQDDDLIPVASASVPKLP